MATPTSMPRKMVPKQAASHSRKSRKFVLYRWTASLWSNRRMHAAITIAPSTALGRFLQTGENELEER